MKTKNPAMPTRASNEALGAPSTIRRIRFVPAPDGTGLLRRRYTQPTAAVALESDLAANDLTTALEPNRLIFVELTALTSAETRQLVQRWWAAGVAADPAIETTTIEVGDWSVRWRPGRIIVETERPISVELTDALIDFAYHESTLRELEATLGKYETTAVDDVPRAFRIESKDEAHWSKFGDTIESLARMRLTFARLEPELDRTNRKLPREDRRLLARLEALLGVEDRCVAFSDRLEACEDLYEGATDRVTDYRGWRTGHRLELWIIALLAFEVALLSIDIGVQIWSHFTE